MKTTIRLPSKQTFVATITKESTTFYFVEVEADKANHAVKEWVSKKFCEIEEQ